MVLKLLERVSEQGWKYSVNDEVCAQSVEKCGSKMRVKNEDRKRGSEMRVKNEDRKRGSKMGVKNHYIVSSLFHASFLNTERARLRITITIIQGVFWVAIGCCIGW